MVENERVMDEIKREPGVAELMELYERIERVYAPAFAAALPFEESATSDSTSGARTKKFAKAPSLTASKQSQI